MVLSQTKPGPPDWLRQTAGATSGGSVHTQWEAWGHFSSISAASGAVVGQMRPRRRAAPWAHDQWRCGHKYGQTKQWQPRREGACDRHAQALVQPSAFFESTAWARRRQSLKSPATTAGRGRNVVLDQMPEHLHLQHAGATPSGRCTQMACRLTLRPGV
jgi:hypothetical protein